MELQLRLPGDWPVGQHRHAPPEPAGDDLESVLTWLQEVEINAWIRPRRPRTSRQASMIHTAARTSGRTSTR